MLALLGLPRDPFDRNPPSDEESRKRITSQPLADGSVLRFGDTDSSGVYKMVIGRNPNASEPTHGVSGNGEEDIKGRSTGCSFSCGGVKDREADVIAMCKSVRITYDASKVK